MGGTIEVVELTLASKLSSAEKLSSAVKEYAGRVGFTEDEINFIELAVHEAMINAIIHGNQQADDKRVDVQFQMEADALTISIRDRGAGFSPEELPDPTDADNLLKPSGRGIFFMRTFMDEVDYAAHPEGGSIVRLKKYRR
jgi:serine/threonine-protein kinase RsbW